MTTNYKNSGVDIQAADNWTSTLSALTSVGAGADLRKRLLSGIGDYAAVFELQENLSLALSCDGVGTKLLWTLEGLGSMEALAIDLLAMNVNDLLCVGARPLLFLDYLAVSSPDLIQGPDAPLGKFIRGLQSACSASGMLLVGGETAQMPDLYQKGHFDLAGFAVGTLSPEERLGPQRLKAGAEIWGWESSGPHSNGYSLLRKVFNSKRDRAFIEENLMRPTELYVEPLAKLRAALKAKTQANALLSAFHITGSGLLNLLRYETPFSFELSDWPAKGPQWFERVISESKLTRAEALSTFNGGFGMLLVVDTSVVENSTLQSHGLRRLGKVVATPPGEKSYVEVSGDRLHG